MHQLALVVLDTRDIRPFEIVQDSTSVNEELRFILNNTSTDEVADSELPHAFRCVPLGMFDLVLELDVLVDEIVLFVDSFEVFEDLWRV